MLVGIYGMVKVMVGPIVTILGFVINYNYTKKMVKKRNY